MKIPSVPPTTDPKTDGAALLNDVRDAIRRHCVLPTQEALDAVTLWVGATHCVTAFDYAPRLIVRSAEKRSGKTRLLEIIGDLVHDPLKAVNATVPAIFRSLGDHPPTLLFDEMDTMFGSRKAAEQNEDLRGLINAGFQRGQDVLRTVGPNHIPTAFPTFAMAALAGIGRLPDTIEDRAIVVAMKRRAPGEQVQPYRLRADQPRLLDLREELSAWSMTIIDNLERARPDLPVEDRAADTWEPLIAIADAAGGHWPETARIACKSLVAEAMSNDDEASLNVRLLADIADVFAEEGVHFMNSQRLAIHLVTISDAPWEDIGLNANKLSRRLRDYGIRPKRNSTGTERGYRREDFTDAFRRYLPSDRQKPSESSEALESEAESG